MTEKSESMQPQIPHDAFLREIVVNWKEGTATLRFGHGESDLLLNAKGLNALHIPRENPWGPSEWVNSSEGPTSVGDDLLRFVVEMQSGDMVEIRARSISVHEAQR